MATFRVLMLIAAALPLLPCVAGCGPPHAGGRGEPAATRPAPYLVVRFDGANVGCTSWVWIEFHDEAGVSNGSCRFKLSSAPLEGAAAIIFMAPDGKPYPPDHVFEVTTAQPTQVEVVGKEIGINSITATPVNEPATTTVPASAPCPAAAQPE